MAAIATMTKRQVRQALLRRLLPRDDYLTLTPSTAAVGSIIYSQRAGVYPSSHWKNGEIRALIGASTVETQRIAEFDGETCAFTPVSAFSGTPTNVEIVRASGSFEVADLAIEDAIRHAASLLMSQAKDETHVLWRGETAFEAPDDWQWLERVQVEREAVGGDRWLTLRTDGFYESGLKIAAATTKLGQQIYLHSDFECGGVALALRHIGTSTATLTAAIEATSSDLPTGTQLANASSAITADGVDGGYALHVFPFAKPVVIPRLTTYGLTLTQTDAVDASDYVAWQYDAVSNYSGGTRLLNDGSSWAAATGAFYFRLLPARPRWLDLSRAEVDITGVRDISLRPSWGIAPGTWVSLAGLKTPNLLATDSAICDIDPTEVMAMASAIIIENKSLTSLRLSSGASNLRAQAEAAWASRRTLPSGLSRNIVRN